MINTNMNILMCANMVIQNILKIQKTKEKEEQETKKVQGTFKSTLNKEKQKEWKA